MIRGVMSDRHRNVWRRRPHAFDQVGPVLIRPLPADKYAEQRWEWKKRFWCNLGGSLTKSKLKRNSE
jgi:hypothetical protein